MKFVISLLATAIFSIVAGMYAPWWSVAFAAGLVGLLMKQKAGLSFLSGFLGVGLTWLCFTWWIDQANGGILSARMAHVLPMGGQVLYLHLATALLGGIIGGLAALSGTFVRSIVQSEN